MLKSRAFLSYRTAQKNKMGVAGVNFNFNKIFAEASSPKREEISSHCAMHQRFEKAHRLSSQEPRVGKQRTWQKN
jgi:hypothetical protein